MKIIASQRTVSGTRQSRRLRNTGYTPGVVYGSNKNPINISVHHNNLYYSLKKEMFHSSILELEIDGKSEEVLLRDFQPHAYKKIILHIDFQRVQATQKIHVKIPLHFINSDISPAVKISSGIISHVLTELDISCLPKNLPRFIEVDLRLLEIGHSVHLTDLKLPHGVIAVAQENLTIATASTPTEQLDDENQDKEEITPITEEKL